MAAYTIADFLAKEVAPASISTGGVDGYKIFEYILDGNKGITVAAADTVDIWALAAKAGLLVHAASLETLVTGTASGTLDVQIAPAGTPADVTGLTAWALDAAVGTVLTKVATGANFATHTSATVMRVQINTAGLGSGRWVLKVYGVIVS